jgi:hypothetical protein
MRPNWQQKKAGYACEAFIIKKNMKLSARIAFLSLLHGASCIAVADQAFGQSRIYGPVTNVESPNSFIMYQQPSGPANPTARAGVADVRGDYAMAIGAAATAHAFEALAIGHESEARQTPNAPTDQVGEAGRAIAIGARAKAYDTGIAIGLTSVAGAGSDVGVLDYRPSAIAIGQNTFARTTESIAIGKLATVTEEKALGQNGDRSIAIGRSATITGSQNSVAIGTDVAVLGNSPSSISLGFGALVQGKTESGIAIGTDAIAATGDSVIAIGKQAMAGTGESVIAIGKQAMAKETGSTAIGFLSKAENGSLAMGTLAVADGKDSIALGDRSLATGGQGGIAIGQEAIAKKGNATAIGRASLADYVNSTALGAGAITTRNNQVVIGTSIDTVTVPNVAGSGNQFLFATADGTLNRYTGATTIDSDLLISGSQAIGGNLTVGGDVVFNNYKNTNPGSGTTFLSTDANGKVALAAIPNGTTFCTLVGANSSCYGPNAEAKGAFDTAIGANSRADAALGSTALGAETNASGNGSTAIGVLAKSQGEGSLAVGFAANSTAEDGIAIGSNALANGFNAFAFGTGAVANGRNVTAIGFGARAEGFNTNSLALGTGSLASGTDVTALGAGATATGVRATAIGAGAMTTRNNQVVIGTQRDTVTLPGLSGSGTALVAANNDGTLQRSSVSLQQVNQAVNTTIPKLESAVSDLGQAVESAGAIAAAMSAIPQVSLRDDEPMRCGVGTGGYGSQYAVSAGCAVRVADRLHINGALAYTPSIDYQYGSTPSVAGRLGFSFPLGRIAKASSKPTAETSKELSDVQGNLEKIQAEVKSRDSQIADLKTQLDQLLKAQRADTRTPVSQATTELIAMLKSRIDQLEKEKIQSQAENKLQDKKIQLLENRLAEQESMFQRAMEQLKSLVGGKPLELGPTSKANR